MTKKKQVGLLLTNALISLCLVGCDSSVIGGDWIVTSKSLLVEEKYKYVLEASPGVLERKFNRMFPGDLDEGDKITFISDSTLTINGRDTMYYISMENEIHLLQADMIFPLKYDRTNDELIISRNIEQGVIKWTLAKR